MCGQYQDQDAHFYLDHCSYQQNWDLPQVPFFCRKGSRTVTGLGNVSKREDFLFTVDACRCKSRVRGGGGGEYFPFVIVVSYGRTSSRTGSLTYGVGRVHITNRIKSIRLEWA
jgi:hypothetical protein